MSYRKVFGDGHEGACAQGASHSELVGLETVSGDFRSAKHALAQVLNRLVDVGSIALACTVGHDRSARRHKSDERVLIALFKLMSLSPLLLLVDERP